MCFVFVFFLKNRYISYLLVHVRPVSIHEKRYLLSHIHTPPSLSFAKRQISNVGANRENSDQPAHVCRLI